MRVLAGRFKSLSVKTSNKLSYRPTKSRVRKSLFDKLSPFKYDTVLDLFSGSGIMGFESASRGASAVTFVEKDHKSISLLKENSQRLVGPKFEVIQSDVLKFLKEESAYDLIFADPPYGKFDLATLAESILEHLNKGGKFILECERNQDPILDSDFADYGNTRLLTWTP